MNSFPLHLQSGTNYKKFDDVVSFIGADASGNFGLMARHERMMTVLEFGLARFRTSDEAWHYLALPGGILYFVDNEMFISTLRFFHGNDYDKAVAAISGALAQEEVALQNFKRSVGKIEQELIRRLWKLERQEM